MKKTEAISILATSVRPREAEDRERYDEAVGMAIEALKCSEIPNSSDSISRQAEIDALDIAIERYGEIAEKYRKKADIERNDYMDMRDNAYEAQQLAQWLNELKYLREKIEQITIMPEPRWTPCSERLPEEGQKCLVCDKGSIGIDIYIGHGNPYNWKWYTRDYEAWVPLPDPYKGGEK